MKFECCDYKKWTPENTLIYCDPPYAYNNHPVKYRKSTKKYDVFNNIEFWDKMREWSKDNFVFIWIQRMDPCVITPDGAVVPLRVIDGVPYLESNDFRMNCRGHFNNCSDRFEVIGRDGCVEIS